MEHQYRLGVPQDRVLETGLRNTQVVFILPCGLPVDHLGFPTFLTGDDVRIRGLLRLKLLPGCY